MPWSAQYPDFPRQCYQAFLPNPYPCQKCCLSFLPLQKAPIRSLSIHPLLETSIEGATDAIINVTGGPSLTLFEVEEAAEVVRKSANTDINTIFGAIISENLTDEIIVTVIATGFEEENEPLYSQYARRENTTTDTDEDGDVGADIPFFKRRSF